jgi:hypothetical protein
LQSLSFCFHIARQRPLARAIAPPEKIADLDNHIVFMQKMSPEAFNFPFIVLFNEARGFHVFLVVGIAVTHSHPPNLMTRNA